MSQMNEAPGISRGSGVQSATTERQNHSISQAPGHEKTPVILALQQKKIPAWPGRALPGSAAAVPLHQLCGTSWDSDVHFVAYQPTASLRRLSKAIFSEPDLLRAEGGVRMHLAVFDCDDPVAHQTETPARDSWRSELAPKLHRLNQAHPGLFAYWTRGGARLLWRIAPIQIESPVDWVKWEGLYHAIRGYLLSNFGVETDQSCHEVTRLFRAPLVTRDGVREAWPALLGDPSNVGTLVVDVRRFVPLLKAPKARPASASARAYPREPFNPLRAGLLPTLLANRGHLGVELEPGKWACKCPSSHLRGDHGLASDTIVFAAREGADRGWIHCSHNRCTDWQGNLDLALKWFRTDELARAAGQVSGFAFGGVK